MTEQQQRIRSAQSVRQLEQIKDWQYTKPPKWLSDTLILPNDYQATKLSLLSWSVFLAVATVLAIILKATILLNINLAQEIIAMFVINLIVCSGFAVNPWKDNSITTVLISAGFFIAPFVFLLLRLPYAGYSFLFMAFILIISLIISQQYGAVSFILNFLLICSTVVILFKFDGRVELSWQTTLLIPQLIVVAIFAVLVHKLFTKPIRLSRLRFAHQIITVGFMVIFFCPFWISIFWIYSPYDLQNILSMDILLNCVCGMALVSFYRQIVYALCENFAFKIVQRKTEITFTRRRLEKKNNVFDRQPIFCIRCQREFAIILSNQCCHLSFCQQCLQKSSKEECPICKSLTRFDRVNIGRHAQDRQFKFRLFGKNQYKVYFL